MNFGSRRNKSLRTAENAVYPALRDRYTHNPACLRRLRALQTAGGIRSWLDMSAWSVLHMESCGGADGGKTEWEGQKAKRTMRAGIGIQGLHAQVRWEH